MIAIKERHSNKLIFQSAVSVDNYKGKNSATKIGAITYSLPKP